MSFYNDTNYNGQLWLRDVNNNVKEAPLILSSVFVKYEKNYPDFYYDLSYNVISKFEVFNDCIFVQTRNGYIFEKVTYSNEQIKPYSLFNYYNPIQSTNIDYYFNEKLNKVYFCGFNDLTTPLSGSIRFSLFFKEFDLQTGQITKNFDKTITFPFITVNNLISSDGIKEDPKLAYNLDTNIFNVSFLVKNDVFETGLISLNFNENDITEINIFAPYGEIDFQNYSIINTFIPPTPTPTPTITPTITPTNTPTPTVTKTPTRTIKPTQTPTITKSKSLTPTPTVTKTNTPSFTPSKSLTPTITPSSTSNIPVIRSIYVSFE
jgi:hypothetical protein